MENFPMSELYSIKSSLQGAFQLDENQYKHTDTIVQELRGYLKNLTFHLNQNKGKDKREVDCCTLCRTKGHHKNEFPTFAQYLGEGMKNPLPIEGPWCEICRTCLHDP
jgi:hypothetical protein